MAAAKKKKPSATYKDPVFTWPFKSKKPLAGGVVLTYITQLNQDGKLSCNCQGWIFSRTKDKNGKEIEKACKHTRALEEEAPKMFKMWKNGEGLPVLEEEVDTPSLVSSNPGSPKSTATEPKKVVYGRYVMLDD